MYMVRRQTLPSVVSLTFSTPFLVWLRVGMGSSCANKKSGKNLNTKLNEDISASAFNMLVPVCLDFYWTVTYIPHISLCLALS